MLRLWRPAMRFGRGGRASTRSPHLAGGWSGDVDKKPLVGDLVVGASIIYRSFKVSYAQVFRSKEFDAQGRRHKFGSLSLAFSF